MSHFALTLLLAWFCGESSAQELQENFVPIRPLGMGGAFTAIANDETAMWLNPAGVSRARKHRNRFPFYLTKVPNIGLGVNGNAKNLYASNSSDDLAETVAESGDLGESNPYWVHLHIFPVMLFDYSGQAPGGFGVFSITNNRMLISEDTPDQTQINLISDLGLIKNFTWTNRTNRFSAGVNFRYINRYALEDMIPTNEVKNRTELQTRFQENANQSTAIAADAGVIFTFADFWFPTVGLAVLNIPTGCQEDYLNPVSKMRETVCGTKYQGDLANPEALSVIDPTDIRVGVSMTPRITQKFAFRLGLDVHHLYLSTGTQTIGLPGIELQKMLHAGIEFFYGNPLLPSPFSIRIGSGQGFISTGISMRLKFWSLDFATYGVDISAAAKPVQDRRTVLGTSFIW